MLLARCVMAPVQRLALSRRPCEDHIDKSGKQSSKNADLERPSRGGRLQRGVGRRPVRGVVQRANWISYEALLNNAPQADRRAIVVARWPGCARLHP